MRKDVKVLHVYFKETDKHEYYGSLKVIYDHNNDIGISRDMLYKHDFKKPFENDKVIIRHAILIRAPKNMDS